MAAPCAIPQVTLEQITTHLVFSRNWPSTYDSCHEHESLLVTLVFDAIQSINEIYSLPLSSIKLLQNFQKLHPLVDATTISTELQNLKPGEMLGMYVRKQNSCLMIYNVPTNATSCPPNEYVVSTFPVLLDKAEIHGCDSDIQFNYPVQSLKVQWSNMFGSVDFANQLCLLHDMESKKNNISNYLSKWLVTVLSDRNSATTTEFPSITKKVRDEVLGSFQRSGYWMTIKVLLQLNLTVEFGQTDGCFVYKLIILKFLTKICDLYNQNVYETLNIDLMNQMLAKLARRIEKLTTNGKPMDASDASNHFTTLYVRVINEAKSVISKIRNKIDHQIEGLIKMDVRKSQLAPMINLNFEADIVQKVPNLMEYIKQRNNKHQRQKYDGKLRTKKFARHYINEKHKPDLDIFDKLNDEIATNLFLSDYENWFLYELSMDAGNLYAPTDLRKMFFQYSTKATSFYKDDPIGASKMLLVYLKFVKILDMIATRDYPMFLKHRTGINSDIFDNLLLPQQIDMQIVVKLQMYFKTRNLDASLPALIEEDRPSEQSFAVKYAENNHELETIRQAVQKEATNRIEAKRIEWQSTRAEVESMKSRAQRMPCDYQTNHRNGFTEHAPACRLCALREQIKGMKISPYERPLPSEIHLQDAILFELRIPIQIACLRDVLFEVAQLMSKRDDIHGGSGHNELWINYDPISAYNQSICERVQLSSTSSLNLSHCSEQHVDYPFESFILKNGYNCRYRSSENEMPTKINEQSPKQLCTLKVEHGSPYENLQWTLDGTMHTQNAVLSKQSDCSTALSLSEYKNFGSLRADGYRLQLRKLYGMIKTEAISFETPSVLALLMQTLWETGPIGQCDRAHRESHEDFTDMHFAIAMIEMLDKFIKQQENNWKHPLKLLTTALIAVRIFELNSDESVADRIVKLLQKLREVTIEWMTKIQDAIQESHKNNSSETSLREKLIDVSIAGAATFFVHFRHEFFAKIFFATNGQSALRMWLDIIVTLNNSNLLNSNSDESEVKTKHHIFLRFVRNIGISVERNMQQMIEANPIDVFDFIKTQWTPAKHNGTFDDYYFVDEQPQMLIVPVFVENERNDVFIDLITGEFEVNNQPVAKLSLIIAKAAIFQRVFQQFAFEVQPGEPNCFSTVRKYRNCSYDFCAQPNSDAIIITERRTNDMVYELLPHNIFAEEIPYLLVENYSHWWNRTMNIIEFRPKFFRDDQFLLPIGVEYELNLNSHQLIHLKTKRPMLDVNSSSYQSIVNQLSRLECKKYIHILMDKPKVAKVELMRMHLKFEIDTSNSAVSEYDIVSNEFSGMRVSLNQKNGTLFGLNHGLYLESGQDKLLILPHGEISFSTYNHHATVTINVTGELNNPPFHAYCVDDFLQQITAKNSSYSAWLYLAYLHALTSLGTPDTFTGQTGTEQALQILHPGFIWSSPSAPYDLKSLNLQTLIAKLSPVRTTKRHSKTVEWPTNIPTHAVQDSFICIVTELIADSQRLCDSNSETDQQTMRSKLDPSLNRRDYLRWLQLYPNLRISNIFIEHETLTAKQSFFQECGDYLENTRITSILYHENKFHVANDFDLKHFLTKTTLEGRTLDGLSQTNHIDSILNHHNELSLANLWISLYEKARQQQISREKFALVLSLFAHQGRDLKPILALQTVMQNVDIFATVNPPNVPKYNVSDFSFSADVISQILQSYQSHPLEYYSEYSEDQRTEYRQRIKENIRSITDAISKKWPCDAVDSSDYISFSKDISIDSAFEQINTRLLSWNNNRKLLLFIDEVEEKFQLLRYQNADIKNFIEWSNIAHHQQSQQSKRKFSIDFQSKLCEQINKHEFEAEVEEAQKIYNNRIAGEPEELTRSADEWWQLFLQITRSPSAKHLIDAQMYPRLVKTVVLPELLMSQLNDKLKSIIGAFAITLTHEQRVRRIATFQQQPNMLVALERENETKPHSNWLPCKYPEWLLFEIEQNISIRPIQIKIAERMIEPSNTETQHSVMQLNMGEGKTSVIVPILASVLSDGGQVCQITVLKSLYATNLKLLRKYLGGMLNRRIYTFPCRRDMPIHAYVEKMMAIYEECKRQKGVIITLPEYRLSFQLKIYEMVCKKNDAAAAHFLNIHKWMNANVRNILDESDAILQAKYQLIYTIGDRKPLDGGAARWITIQALLQRIPYHMKRLYQKHGNTKIEFDTNYLQNSRIFGADKVNYRPDVFTPCRILDKSVYAELKEALVDDFLNGKIDVIFSEVVAAAQNHVRRLLVEKNIDKDTFDRLIKEFPKENHHILLILGGLLRFEVLQLVLMKRWRVNYGVNENGVHKMAIPFKAKDVAAEMTEFGHPDVALCFTHLSYYYSGLTDAQLREVFNKLETEPNPAEIYEDWIKSMPTELVDVSMQSYSGINLTDPKQRDEMLFPAFRYNMRVINYWLSNAVFPREARTFEKKLMCTAWDLCTEHMKHTVSGFSGTNDTKHILPLTISQNDLPELEQTNENVRQTLLLPENQAYESLSANVSGKAILDKLVDRKIPVLLDSGALMLELNNEQVANEWLERVSSDSFDAAVFFDARDVLMTVDRNGIMAEFDCSVYRDKLDRCLVYLDDVHTRGTDLKFPLGWKACVTLSAEITRDKTVQACMRMRLLGKGQSIAFWASFEADVRIRQFCQLNDQERPTNEHVIQFICDNSQQLQKENVVHWAAAAYNYAKKMSAHKFVASLDDANAVQKLSSRCFDNEFATLFEMYGGKEDVLVSHLSQLRFDKLSNGYKDSLLIKQFIDEVSRGVDEKIRTNIPDEVRHTGSLHEKQEKELDHEVEEERQIERPPKAKPAKPNVDPLLMQLISFGATHSSFQQLKKSESILSVEKTLQNTKMFDSLKDEISPWSEHIYVTKDFVHVVEGRDDSNRSERDAPFTWDSFLRPVWWIACIRDNLDKYQILLLSSYECDALLPKFRSSKYAALHMYRARTSEFHSNLLHDKQLCVTGMSGIKDIDLKDEVQIGVIAGALYFGSDAEQDAFCAYLGLIPRPRTNPNLHSAFENGIIEPNGFVPMEHRQHSIDIAKCVGHCTFQQNPVYLVNLIIEAHHEFMRTESHVASILQKGIKAVIQNHNNS